MNSLLGRLLFIVGIAVIPALAVQFYLEHEVLRARQQLIEEEALRFVRFVSAEQQATIEGANQMLTALAVSPAVQDNVAEACQRHLSSLEQATPHYHSLAVIGLDGHPICASVQHNPAADLSNQVYFKQALETGGFVLGEHATGRLSGQPAIQAARPFKGRDGRVAGVVVAEISLAWLEQQLETVPLSEGASVAVIDRNGIVLARHPQGNRFVGTPLSAANLHLLTEPKPGIVSLISMDGLPRITAFIPPAVGPGGLLLTVGLDLQTTLAPLVQARRTGTLLFVTGAVLALALTALLGIRLIRRPVDHLLQSAARWRTGDFSARTGLRGDRSEFGRLAAAFDAMAAALQARERALRSALESTTDTVIALDPDWRFTYLNQRAQAQFDPDRDLLGQTIWSVFQESSTGAFGEACRQAMDNRVPAHTEAYYAALDTHWEIHAYPSDNGITVFSRNVTQQRRVTAALRHSEERMRVAVEAARLGVRELDLVANTVVWTPNAAGIFGRDFVSRVPLDALVADVHPDDQPRLRAEWDRAISVPGHDYEVEYRFRNDSGDWHWICSYGRMLFEAGRPIRQIAVVQDISDRKQAEADLVQATALLRAIGNSSADAIYAKGADGRMLYANPAVLAIIGKSGESVIGGTEADWLSDPRQAAAIVANDQRVIRTGQSEVFEEAYDTAGPTKRVFRSAKSPLRLDDGTVIGIVGYPATSPGSRMPKRNCA
jgi:PAS domain S-box-containing protein